jgi:hypothetical protein
MMMERRNNNNYLLTSTQAICFEEIVLEIWILLATQDDIFKQKFFMDSIHVTSFSEHFEDSADSTEDQQAKKEIMLFQHVIIGEKKTAFSMKLA